MKNKDIFEALGGIDADVVLAAAPDSRKKRRLPLAFRVIAAVLATVITASVVVAAFLVPRILDEGGIFFPHVKERSYVLAMVKYPEMVMAPKKNTDSDRKSEEKYEKEYDAWRRDISKRADPCTDIKVLIPFFSEMSKEFLIEENDDNIVFSPLSIYMTMAMMGETAPEGMQQQIYDMLGVPNETHLRAQASRIWRSTYRDDGAIKSVLANSIWLNDEYEYDQAPLDALAEFYYTSSYRGNMTDGDFVDEYCNWINDNTGDLFDVSKEDVPWDSRTDICISSSMYFAVKWQSGFNSKKTESKTFYTPNGEVKADFMTETYRKTYLYLGENFCAVPKTLQNGGNTWFILPDEGSTVEEVIASDEFMRFVMGDTEGIEEKLYKLTINVPKFDISDHSDATEKIREIAPEGLLTNGLNAISDKMSSIMIRQESSLKIDEEGIVGGSHVSINRFLSGLEYPAKDEAIVTFDSPFIVAVTSAGDVPLFLGVINDPTK